MKTIYYAASSLDGFIADADNSLDWGEAFVQLHYHVSTIGSER